MRRIQNFVFVFLMFLLTSITVLRFHHIQRFRAQSQEHVFEVEANQKQIAILKQELQSMTYQPVIEELLSDGRYRLIVRCPSDKIGIIQNFLRRE